MAFNKLADGIFIAIIASVVAMGLPLLILSARWDDEFASKCDAAGGVPKIGKGIRICLKPDAMISIK